MLLEALRLGLCQEQQRQAHLPLRQLRHHQQLQVLGLEPLLVQLCPNPGSLGRL
jgi:hypothetical protein